MAILKRHKSTIYGLTDELAGLNQAIGAETLAREVVTGELANLETLAKDNLVVAINEVLSTVESGEGSLKIEQNLADLDNVAEARTNLEVMSATEVSEAIEVAKVALGTNFTVADIAARDALEELDLGDRVLVEDAGDGKWAIFAPKTIVEGEVTEWLKLYDQSVLENSLTAEGIKVAYESNEDTNAFTDAEKAKLGVALVEDDVVTELDLQSEEDQDGPASGEAVKGFVTAQIGAIVQTTVSSEQLVVSDGEITLTEAPTGGAAGVLNFGTVRYIDQDTGVAYDAPVVATADPKVFSISTDTANQWDGNTVAIQYVH